MKYLLEQIGTKKSEVENKMWIDKIRIEMLSGVGRVII